MSGHNKWSKIKNKKAVTDAAKSKVFSKHAALIAMESRKANGNIASAGLASAIERAKKDSMPKENIDRAVAKGAGGEGSKLEEITYEAFGPGGAGLIIIAQTDNPNRTVAEVRTILKEHDSTLSGPGSVRWKFDDELKPKFSQPLPDADLEKLRTLTESLENHSDIAHVYSDTIQ